MAFHTRGGTRSVIASSPKSTTDGPMKLTCASPPVGASRFTATTAASSSSSSALMNRSGLPMVTIVPWPTGSATTNALLASPKHDVRPAVLSSRPFNVSSFASASTSMVHRPRRIVGGPPTGASVNPTAWAASREFTSATTSTPPACTQVRTASSSWMVSRSRNISAVFADGSGTDRSRSTLAPRRSSVSTTPRAPSGATERGSYGGPESPEPPTMSTTTTSAAPSNSQKRALRFTLTRPTQLRARPQ